MKIEAVKADITSLAVDVVVNAANNSLRGGGGVDGAIHRAAGPELLKACEAIGGCKTGDAKLTPGFGLPANYVIHTVGPVWHGGKGTEADQLSSCYRRSLLLAREANAQSIAFPAISTGVYGYPLTKAAKIAVNTVATECESKSYSFSRIVFCCFSDDDLLVYQSILARL